jgi:secretion/DNA translocation related TadE-like protein
VITRDNDESGAALVIMIALCAVCVIAVAGLMRLGEVVVVRARVQNAADAASLSAAFEIARGRNSSACASAKKAAGRNDARVIDCEKSVNSVEVVVQDQSTKVQARSRADVD